jgi:type I restriction enzyme, R subunit
MTYQYSEDELIEQTAIELLHGKLGWDTAYAFNTETFGSDSSLGRLGKQEIILKRFFLEALKKFNDDVPENILQQAVDLIEADTSTKSLEEINREKYFLLRDGIPVEYTNANGETINRKLRVFDFETASENNFLAVRQLWIEGKAKRKRRTDIIGYVNGLPLLFIELKASHKKLENAYNENFTDYKDVIPKLFHTNAFVILSNGIESKIGSITAKFHHFNEWKRIIEEEEGIVSLDTILTGVCEKNRFMDLFENFILYDNSLGKVVKLIARNHQFLGVNKAIENIKLKKQLSDEGKIELDEKQKLGVFWHTQGSGKSYSMVFMCQKIHRKLTGSYTFLIATDRDELDKQIYGTFAGTGAVNDKNLRAKSGEHLQQLLQTDARYIFTLVHKFNFNKEITLRENVIVISDEAHRTQGGRLALNMRNALPKASFIGFTGTPLFKDDEMTKRIFGDYVSRYDFKRSVDDGATVPLYYENRGELLKLKNPKITQQMRDIIEQEDLSEDQETRLEQLFAREYPVLTAHKRLDAIAKDVVWHFNNRGYKGKGMMICLDKLTAVKMYDLITAQWNKFIEDAEKALQYGKDEQEQLIKARELKWIKETEIAVVVSSEQNEIQKFRNWNLDIEPHREKMNTRDLETEFKEEDHPFRFVIVCAMWITGFDVPSLSTMYLDKPLKSHTLMQAIARANRVNTGKNNGLIVDYIETYENLLDALAIYGSDVGTGTEGGAIEPPVKPKAELIHDLEEALEETENYLREELRFDTNEMINAPSRLDRLAAVARGVNAVYTNDETKNKFQILAREVFKKNKALMPDKILNDYRERIDAVQAIYRHIEENIETADVSAIMKRIQDVVDESVSIMSESGHDTNKIIDLSHLNFEALQNYFLQTEHKNTTVQSLKDKIEERLKSMVDRNPLRVDFYLKYQEIIDDYNRGKDAITVEETFNRLIEFVNSLSEEEARIKREGLNDEQAALFDLIRKPDLKDGERNKVKEVAIVLLEELKKEKLQVPLWSEKSTTAAAVHQFVNDYLFSHLPYPTYLNPEIETKTSLVYEHLKHQYKGEGISVYGPY